AARNRAAFDDALLPVHGCARGSRLSGNGSGSERRLLSDARFCSKKASRRARGAELVHVPSGRVISLRPIGAIFAFSAHCKLIPALWTGVILLGSLLPTGSPRCSRRPISNCPTSLPRKHKST